MMSKQDSHYIHICNLHILHFSPKSPFVSQGKVCKAVDCFLNEQIKENHCNFVFSTSAGYLLT